MIQLRDYQLDAVNTIWARFKESSSVLCVMATGAGKTEVMIEIMRRALEIKPTLKFCVLVQKLNLLNQTVTRFRKQLKSVSIYCGSEGENDLSGQVIVATIQSISNVKIDGLSCIVFDECHNVDEEQGRYSTFLELNDSNNLKILGFTATPFRSDGLIYGEDKLFEQIDFEMGLTDLIEKGFLVKPLLKKPDHQLDTSSLRIRMGEYVQEDVSKLTEDQDRLHLQITDALGRMNGRKKAVWACASINHAEMVCSNLIHLGENAAIIHSNLSNDERSNQQYRFEKTDCRHLVFVTIVSEGYDYPSIDTIVLMRPTRSPVLYVQTIGRGLRLAEGKTDCLVLDYGKVIETLGPLDDPKVKRNKYERLSTETEMKVCPECHEYNFRIAQYCVACNYQFFDKNKGAKELKPETELKIFSTPEEIEIKKVSFAFHKAKSGNDCLKITYHPINILNRPVDEFFVFNNEWAYKKLQRRFFDLGARIYPTIEESVKQAPINIPKSITVKIKDGYKNITKMRF